MAVEEVVAPVLAEARALTDEEYGDIIVASMNSSIQEILHQTGQANDGWIQVTSKRGHGFKPRIEPTPVTKTSRKSKKLTIIQEIPVEEPANVPLMEEPQEILPEPVKEEVKEDVRSTEYYTTQAPSYYQDDDDYGLPLAYIILAPVLSTLCIAAYMYM